MEVEGSIECLGGKSRSWWRSEMIKASRDPPKILRFGLGKLAAVRAGERGSDIVTFLGTILETFSRLFL
jgi:hypothetical protein